MKIPRPVAFAVVLAVVGSPGPVHPAMAISGSSDGPQFAGQRSYAPGINDSESGSIALEPFGNTEGLVLDPSGGFVLVRFDPPFSHPYTIESITFVSHTRNGVPAVFPSVRVCGVDASFRPSLTNPLFIQEQVSASPDGRNSIATNIRVDDLNRVFYVAIEFPLRGPTYPLDHPGIAVDVTDLERGTFSATYLIPPSGFMQPVGYVNAAIGMSVRPSDSAGPPVVPPSNLSANRVGGRVVFSFEASKPDENSDAGTLKPSLRYELFRRTDLGPWQLVASTGPGKRNFEIESGIPTGRSRWAVQGIGPTGERSVFSNVETLDHLTNIQPLTSWGPEEPNGAASEALPIAPPVGAQIASLFPSGDRDFYSLSARAGDFVRISAAPGVVRPNTDTLGLAAVLYDEHGRTLAYDHSSFNGRYPLIEYLVPKRGTRDQVRSLTVEFFDPRGTKFLPETVHRPSTFPFYLYNVEAWPAGQLASGQASPVRPSALSAVARSASGSFDFRASPSIQSAAQDEPLRIYDVHGRLIAVLRMTAANGDMVTRWSGRDGNGTVAPAGVYFARYGSGPLQTSRKFVVTH